MTRVIKNTSQLSDEDLAAMADYLKSLPPVDGPARPKRKETGDKRGNRFRRVHELASG